MIAGKDIRSDYNKTLAIDDIAPLTNEPGPFWSVMIPAFNRTEFLEAALKSVLQEGIPPERMQIEVIENGPINPAIKEIVMRVGKGRVLHYPQPGKVRYTNNWNTCLHRAKGKWVQILHDDDCVLPGFYDAYEKYIEQHPQTEMISSQSRLIDVDGNDIGLYVKKGKAMKVVEHGPHMEQLLLHNFISPPSVVFKHTLLERTGGISNVMFYAADWEFWTRMSSQGNSVFLNQILSCYRTQPKKSYHRNILKWEEPMFQRSLGLTLLEGQIGWKGKIKAKGNIILEGWFSGLIGFKEKGMRYSANIALKSTGNTPDLIAWLYRDLTEDPRDKY